MEFTNPNNEREGRTSALRESKMELKAKKKSTLLGNDDMKIKKKLTQFLKKFEKPGQAEKEVKVADHSNPHVLQVIKILNKPKEDKQTHDLRILEEEIEYLSFLHEIDISGKYLLDVCERLSYLFVEQGDEIVTYDHSYE